MTDSAKAIMVHCSLLIWKKATIMSAKYNKVHKVKYQGGLTISSPLIITKIVCMDNALGVVTK